MKEDRKIAEKRVWMSIQKVAGEAGRKTGWEYLGNPCTAKRINDLMLNFHENPYQPGFYGIRIPMGEVGGLQVSVLIENQKELIIGIQTELAQTGNTDVQAYEAYRAMLGRFAESQNGWNLDSPGWLAWKTPEVRLNFRSVSNRAFQDIIRNRDNSEALYLITEEISDILREISDIVVNREIEVYGTVIN
ncbi:MAG: hypothetical protein V2A67_11490 [Bacteroidota bacterium]